MHYTAFYAIPSKISPFYCRPKRPKLDFDPTNDTNTQQDLDNFLKSQEKYLISRIEDDVVDVNGDTLTDSTEFGSPEDISGTDNENPITGNVSETEQNIAEKVPKPVLKKSGKIATKWSCTSICEDQKEELEANKDKWSGVFDKKHHEETIPTDILRSGDPCLVPLRAEELNDHTAIEDSKRLRHRSEKDSGFESDAQNQNCKTPFKITTIIFRAEVKGTDRFKISRFF